MRIFIVYANPEPNSLGAAMRDRSVEVLRAEGHEVVVSDLYAMQFDPCLLYTWTSGRKSTACSGAII